MIIITYQNKGQQAKQLNYAENSLDELGSDLKIILDQGANILGVFKK